MAKQTASLVCISLILFITVLAQVIVGWNGYNDCPGIPFIPTYLCGPIIAFFAWCLYRSCNVLCWSVTTIFFICWYIAGNAVIYSNYKQLQITDYRRCNKTLYLFAFWSTTLTNILLFICCCCHCEEEADKGMAVQV